MNNVCNILFNKEDNKHKMILQNLVLNLFKDINGDLATQTLSTVLTKRLPEFLENFQKSSNHFNLVIRLSEKGDNQDAVDRSINDIKEALKGIESRLQPRIEPRYPTIVKHVPSIMRELSKYLEYTAVNKTYEAPKDETLKKEKDLYEEISKSFDEHLEEVYGNTFNDLKDFMHTRFIDDIIKTAYYDVVSGNPCVQKDSVLNASIQELKAKYYERLREFVQSLPEYQGDSEIQTLSPSYEDALAYGHLPILRSAFFQYIKNSKDLATLLNSQYVGKAHNENIQKKKDAYRQLLLLTEQINKSKFDRFVKNSITDYRELYDADHFSDSYANLKSIYEKYLKIRLSNSTLKEEEKAQLQTQSDQFNNLISEIEKREVNTLEASYAYTSLFYFDSMLQLNMGKEIAIKEGASSVETLNKYSYSQDLSHTISNWQTSEDNSAEKHVARFVNAIISSIRVYDHVTKEYKGHSLNTTAFIESCDKLIFSIASGNIEFTNIQNANGQKDPRIDAITEAAQSFHDNPVGNISKIFNLLFEEGPNGKHPLIKNIMKYGELTPANIDTLYSIYAKVLNPHNPSSLISKSKSTTLEDHAFAQQALSLINEIVGTMDRNKMNFYTETYYDYDTNTYKERTKKRFYTGRFAVSTQNSINDYVNNRSNKSIWDKYNFKTENNSTYSCVISGHVLTFKPDKVHVAKNYDVPLFNSNVSMRISSDIELPDVEKVQKLRLKISQNKMRSLDEIREELSEKEKNVFDVLRFLERTLELNLISNDGLLTLENFLSTNSESALADLLTLGMRTLMVNEWYKNFEAAKENDPTLTLQRYMQINNSSFYKSDEKGRYHHNRFGRMSYGIVHASDTVMQQWADARAKAEGLANAATTKDGENNSIPNNTVAKASLDLFYYLKKQQNTNTSKLLFVRNFGMIRGIRSDYEIKTRNGKNKKIQTLSAAELYTHNIFDSFWSSFLFEDGNISIQPTTYSDKTDFKCFTIKATKEDMWGGEKHIIRRHLDTVGATIRNIYKDTQNRLRTILGITENVDLNEALSRLTETELSRKVMDYNKNHPKEEPLFVELYKDYVINSDGKLSLNPVLVYANHMYQDAENPLKSNFKTLLDTQRKMYLQTLLKEDLSFEVIDPKHWKYYATKDVPNKVLVEKSNFFNIINTIYHDNEDREVFFKNWVDKNSGTLILGKVYKDKNGAPISRQDSKTAEGVQEVIIEDLKTLKDVPQEALVLNPLLETHFLVDGLYSNNLRYSMTGFEFNHPLNKFNPFHTILKKAKESTVNKRAIKESLKDLNLEPSEEELDTFISELKNTKGLYDFFVKANSKNSVISDFGKKVANEACLNDMNSEQNTQYKRNVALTATVQYCQQNLKDGIVKNAKVAYIRDNKAIIYNYRGDEEKEDSCDGLAYITSFQSIMENNSLGSHASGAIKKPLWHAYNPITGGAMLGKFSTNTITNELMRMSTCSTVSMRNLFKKMTNLQWHFTDPDISLTRFYGKKGELDDVEKKNMFQEVMCGGINLYYKNPINDHITEIENLNSELITLYDGSQIPIYYTEEKSAYGNTSTKVYHVFHDTGVKSSHVRCNSIEDVKNVFNTNKNVHTINSLYELHCALGGIYSCEKNGNYNEFSNQVVTNYMCNIGKVINYTKIKKASGEESDNIRSSDKNSQDLYLPLKEMQIAYAFNLTACKEGAQNLNEASRWSDDEELAYGIISTEGLGSQQNSEHDIIDSELTEFSQVITACAAYGYTFHNCNEMFYALARTAEVSSDDIVKGVDGILKSAKLDISQEQKKLLVSRLYNTIGGILFASTKRSVKRENLNSVILEGLKQTFERTLEDKSKDMQIPFSDPNIYSDFLSSVASTITMNSIKRKHPGSGCIMAAGYDIMQYYELPVQEADGTVKTKKLLQSDVLKYAKNDFITKVNNLASIIKGSTSNTALAHSYSKSREFLNEIVRGLKDGSLSLPENSKERLSKEIEHLEKYPSANSDFSTFGHDLIKAYTEHIQFSSQEKKDPRDFFIHDSVVIYQNGEEVDRFTLDQPSKYYDFLDTYKEGYTFKFDCTKPINLKPAILKFNILQGNISIPYSYFNLPFVKTAITNGYNTEDPVYRDLITRALHEIQEGKEVTLNDIEKGKDGKLKVKRGAKVSIQAGSIVNEPAELVMGNIFRDKFGIEKGETLQEVKDRGFEYFKEKIKRVQASRSDRFNMAFLKESGDHITVSWDTKGNSIGNNYIPMSFDYKECQFDYKTRTTYLKKRNKRMFKISQWVELSNEEAAKIEKREDGKYVKTENGVVTVVDTGNNKYYNTNKDGKLIKRVDLVRKYKLQSTIKVGNGEYQNRETLHYDICSFEIYKSLYPKKKEEDLKRDYLSFKNGVLSAIASNDSFVRIEYNPQKAITEEGKKTIKEDLKLFIDKLPNRYKGFFTKTLDNYSEDTKNNEEQISKYYDEIITEQAKKKYMSFLDSTKVIAARIPAQSLQSFMSMKIVGWTESSSNVAYVSHFQTYLQGSDYDIDKAYIMAQNYDSNGVYVGWSPYFDYTSLETLELSKSLPLPRHLEPTSTTSEKIPNTTGISRILLKSFDAMQADPSEENRITFLKALNSVLTIFTDNNYNYRNDLSEKENEKLLDIVNRHNRHKIPKYLEEKAFKNAVSANLYTVSHDIRNRDQCYSPVELGIMRKAASNSPKGKQGSSYNSLNPLTKYTMQLENMVGKNVISIAANAEKIWFNMYYYWTKLLKEGDPEKLKRLKFRTTLHRIQGRNSGIENCESKTVQCIPDLNLYDENIRKNLLTIVEEESLESGYKYVDQVISQLLSAATDNAKELILAKINANANFTRCFTYLIITGYDIQDIVAFMTSPISETIIRNSETNFYAGKEEVFITPAIKESIGLLNLNNFLAGNISTQEVEGVEAAEISRQAAVFNHLKAHLTKKEDKKEIFEILKICNPDINYGDTLDLGNSNLRSDHLIQAMLLYSAFNRDFNMNFTSVDYRINKFYQYLHILSNKLRNTYDAYAEQLPEADSLKIIKMLTADGKEFLDIYQNSSELARVTSSFLNLNQGLPSSKIDLEKKLISIQSLFLKREHQLQISKSLFDEDGKIIEVIEKKDVTLSNPNWERLCKNVQKNSDLSVEDIKVRLENAYKAGIVCGIDPVKLLQDPDYWNTAKEYMEVLKVTVNALDLIDNIPQYTVNKKLLNHLVTIDSIFSVKSRILRSLLRDKDSLDDKTLRNANGYVEQLITLNFLKGKGLSLKGTAIQNFTRFTAAFDSKQINDPKDSRYLDFSRIEDIATFRKFMEEDLYAYLKKNYSSNSFVKHMKLVRASNGQSIIATDIDMVKSNVNTLTKEIFDELVRGMTAFNDEKFGTNENGIPMTITDLFQLYNLLINNNKYGAESLTALFKNTVFKENSILNSYYKYIGKLDNSETILESFKQDFNIAIAPIVSKYAVEDHKEPYIKVKDPIWGYTVNFYTRTKYLEKSMIQLLRSEGSSVKETVDSKYNYHRYVPIEMPFYFQNENDLKAFDFETITKDTRSYLKNALHRLLTANKLNILLNC